MARAFERDEATRKMSPSADRSHAFGGGPRTVPILLGTDAHRYALAWFFNGSLVNFPLSWTRKLSLRKAPLTLIRVERY